VKRLIMCCKFRRVRITSGDCRFNISLSMVCIIQRPFNLLTAKPLERMWRSLRNVETRSRLGSSGFHVENGI
jgi:hypothetical protein